MFSFKLILLFLMSCFLTFSLIFMNQDKEDFQSTSKKGNFTQRTAGTNRIQTRTTPHLFYYCLFEWSFFLHQEKNVCVCVCLFVCIDHTVQYFSIKANQLMCQYLAVWSELLHSIWRQENKMLVKKKKAEVKIDQAYQLKLRIDQETII